MSVKRPVIIGLTGSIGMGKTATAKMFEEAGAVIFDSDTAVHDLYAKNGKAVPILHAVFPDVIVDGAVDRFRLSKHLQRDPLQIEILESFIHPLVDEIRVQAVQDAITKGKKIMVFDLPLLFETGANGQIDKTVVASAKKSVQRKRVLSRPGMSEEKLTMILGRQMPDAEKQRQADYVIRTDKGFDFAREQVQKIMDELTA